MVEARYIPESDIKAFLDPEGQPWQRARPASIALVGTPLGLQPTDAIRASWARREIGAIDRVGVSALHNGAELAVRLEWKDATESRELIDTTVFQDAAAILFPGTPEAPMATMGAPGAAVTAWHWRADDDEAARHLISEGIGTTRVAGDDVVRGRGVWKGGRWRVVLVRSLQVETSEPVAQLKPGQVTGFGVAIWEGNHSERAGIKAFSGDWQKFSLAGVPAARS